MRGINSDLPVRFAPNGGAVPGDRIVGILTPGEGITIYPIQSPILKDFEDRPETWLDLRWDVDEHEPQRFPAQIVVQSVNEPGSLAQVAQVIAENDGNIDNIHMTRQSPDFTTIDHRSRSLRPQASDGDHRAIARQAGGRERRARERLTGRAVTAPFLRLGVNIDHVATIRNARGGRHPDPVRAAKLAVAAGADGITAHLREDRRHIRDEDIARLKAEIDKPLNFEMAATDDMIAIAIRTTPHAACLVPERRAERTTEGGLDVAGQKTPIAEAVNRPKRCRHPRVALHRCRCRADRSGQGRRRAGDRNPYRRLVRSAGR